ncbi:MAG TPA: hypothetical protein ENF41_04445 [Candidatus Bathyarchaeota archaeon]|nr:hypothetical protein [Candidatus Bathyarchaeota archaeon]
MSLELYEEKWFRNAVSAIRSVWAQMVKRSESFDAFVKGIAFVTGLPEAEIRASLPAKNWQKFQAEADKYVSLIIEKLEKAHREKKWARKYRAAWTKRA